MSLLIKKCFIIFICSCLSIFIVLYSLCLVSTKLAAQTLRLLLDLIYHEKVSAPIETVFDVLLAADKYQLTVIPFLLLVMYIRAIS